jgi:hypothetical protein
MRATLGRDPSWEEIFAECKKRGVAIASGVSIFDPVLCELAYRWFCPVGGAILDPFAGGSVRGLVAGMLGKQYVGVDIRAEQVEENRAQAEPMNLQGVEWIEGNSLDIASIAPGEYDFLFSCPPYADLERYSDLQGDISTMDYPAFLADYRAIIAASCAMLKRDRFACFVVGEVRDKNGRYRGFVSDTIQAFEDAGLSYYNEAVLITQAGNAAIRAGGMFTASRKLCKVHQNVLVFVKGDPKAATDAIGPVDFGEESSEKVRCEGKEKG